MGDQLGQAVIGLRAENHVDIGCAGDDFITLGLRHTAGDGDHHRRVGAGAGGFPVAQTAQLGKHLLGGFLADVTGVQDHQVGLVRGRAKGIVQGRQNVGHTLGVVDVHLAAIGFNKEFFWHAFTQKRGW